LSPELAQRARGRVRFVAVLVGGLAVLGMLIWLVMWGTGSTGAAQAIRSGVVSSVLLAFCGVVWVAARSERVGDSLVLDLGLALMVACCFLGSWGPHQAMYDGSGALPYMTWAIPLLILFPLVVPAPPRRMLIAIVAGASADPLCLLLLSWYRGFSLDALTISTSLINPVMAAGVAFFAARMVYGLNVDVTRARKMGSYYLESLIGKGGMGEVWRARHHMLARPAAIKLIRADALGTVENDGQTLLKRFANEAQATASLRSPNTIEIYDFGLSQDQTFYYVMELLDGLDLQTLVEEYGPQPPERVIHLLTQACHSLNEAHQAGLIHRDVKPANLFTCRYGQDADFVKVLDFGLVKEQSVQGAESQMLTARGRIVGTPAFMAPEMALGGGKADGRSDLYALGCVAYWLLTGSLVFEADTPMDVVVKHVRDEPSPPSAVSERPIPAELDQIVLACLEKEPDNRPQSAEALADQLRVCPVDGGWTRERAHKWWDAHRPPTSPPEGGTGRRLAVATKE
jgi:serine/threonine-protein kinase